MFFIIILMIGIQSWTLQTLKLWIFQNVKRFLFGHIRFKVADVYAYVGSVFKDNESFVKYQTNNTR